MSNSNALNSGLPCSNNTRVVYLVNENASPVLFDNASDSREACRILIEMMSPGGVSPQVIEQLAPCLFASGEDMDDGEILDAHVVVALADRKFFIAGFCRVPVPADRIRDSLLMLVVNGKEQLVDLRLTPTQKAIAERAELFGMNGVSHVH